MKKDNQESYSTDTFENAQLKKRIEELESKLKDAEMKAIAYSTMIDIAEDEFKLKIRKKFNTKPFKK
jgi:cell division septum initiation protein DivIVA